MKQFLISAASVGANLAGNGGYCLSPLSCNFYHSRFRQALSLSLSQFLSLALPHSVSFSLFLPFSLFLTFFLSLAFSLLPIPSILNLSFHSFFSLSVPFPFFLVYYFLNKNFFSYLFLHSQTPLPITLLFLISPFLLHSSSLSLSHSCAINLLSFFLSPICLHIFNFYLSPFSSLRDVSLCFQSLTN